MRRSHCVPTLLFVLVSLAVADSQTSAAADPARQAGEILGDAGVQGGLVVHLGCGDGRLTAALRASDAILVQGLDADPKNVAAARRHIASLGLYGKASVDRLRGDRLPYADNLVNLIVVQERGGVPDAELLRVLAPRGVALFADPRAGGENPRFVKPRPDETDEWTHFLHDASGNAVSRDRTVGPPRGVQWIGAPQHARSHEHVPSIQALVSAGGRIFYVADEAPVSSIRATPQWRLVARDAYNGVLLWKRTIETWFPHLHNWGSTPATLQRRVVAAGDRVYATLGLHACLSAVDAATGKTLRVYDQTEGTEEVLVHEGVLLLALRKVTAERTAQFARWTGLAKQDDSPLFTRDTAQPLLKELHAVEARAGRTVMAIDAQSGRLLWRKEGTAVAGLRPNSLSVCGTRVFCQCGREVLCFDLKTGSPLWSAASPPLRVVSSRYVVCGNDETLAALSAETGHPVWNQKPLLCSLLDAFVIGDALWLGGFKPWQGKPGPNRGPSWGPYYAVEHELATGKVLTQIEPEGPGHHHRCWQNKATERFILGGRRGVEFLDLETGDVLWHSWVRGVCKYGVMPANGLLYAPPHACGCYTAAKLTGFYALAPERAKGWEGTAPRDVDRLEEGAAYAAADKSPAAADSAVDWPTYRHDAARSGHTVATTPAKLTLAWQAALRGPLTAPTVAGGKLFVASVDAHTVYALDAASGKPAWQFTAGARVDSPPSVCAGRAIFGCRDGCVYSVRASDGALAWRVLAAREDRRITAWGQLESVSPVHGSVLVRDGAAYVAAGRSSYLDGGIDLCRIALDTGRVLSRTPVYSPDPVTGKQPPQEGPAYMPGALADILTADDEHVYLRDAVLSPKGVAQTEGNPHLFTLTGFLDDTWPHRSYWSFAKRCSLATGCSSREKGLVYGRLLVFDDSTIYGYGRKTVHWSNHLEDGPYRLFAVGRGAGKERWSKTLPIQVRAMVLAGDVIFAAGPAANPRGSDEDRGSLLLAVSAADGAELGRYALDAAPVFDGMAAAGGRLYLAMGNGRVVAFGGSQ